MDDSKRARDNMVHLGRMSAFYISCIFALFLSHSSLQHVTLGPFTQPRLAIPDPASTVRGHATLGLSPSRSLSANRTPRPNFWRASPCDCDLWRLPQTPLPPLTAPSLPIFPSSGVSAPRVSNPESSILLRFTKASGIKRLPSSFKHLLFVNRASALKQQTLEPLTAR
jgi:hypothetical protein